ncbi:MAG TPA: DUF2179 domain-containing protein [Syntrophomonadaceae bacterium]|nr:DUF2179 domain-containing protein [Syntrophomonadaceae bacterium]HNX27852.1 DUF2179 domain-containing protein [Syntrophomonadaceae bacterium]HPR93644.1 DUF2179 domain-containing protein [Syntrophomonadaceae bacterium]
MELTMILELLFIFFARVIDVTLGTIRMIFVIRGDRVPAAAIGFVEIMVYTVALSMVIGSLDNPVKLVIFCTGFAMGVLLGSVIEEKLALGYRGIQVTIEAEEYGLIDELREEGYPVTTWQAYGKTGPKLMLNIIVKRDTAKAVVEHIFNRCPQAFIVMMEPKKFSGGYIKKK